MKFRKNILIDVLVLLVPIIIMLLLKPVLPEKVPIHWGLNGANRFIDKKYSFVLGFVPFVVYELMKFKYSRK